MKIEIKNPTFREISDFVAILLNGIDYGPTWDLRHELKVVGYNNFYHRTVYDYEVIEETHQFKSLDLRRVDEIVKCIKEAQPYFEKSEYPTVESQPVVSGIKIKLFDRIISEFRKMTSPPEKSKKRGFNLDSETKTVIDVLQKFSGLDFLSGHPHFRNNACHFVNTLLEVGEKRFSPETQLMVVDAISEMEQMKESPSRERKKLTTGSRPAPR